MPLDVSSFAQIFKSFTETFETQLSKNELNLDKLQYALEKSLMYSLSNHSNDLNDAKKYIAEHYILTTQSLLNASKTPLTFSQLVSLITFFNDPKRLNTVLQYIPESSNASLFSLLSSLRQQNKVVPALIERKLCLWPQGRTAIPEDASCELMDAALQQLLASPKQIDRKADFIKQLLKRLVTKNPEYLNNDYCYQVIAYMRKPEIIDFEFFKKLIIEVWNTEHSAIKINTDYPIALMSFFADNPQLLDAHNSSVTKIYQDCILRDAPLPCTSLISALKTEKQADFLLSRLQEAPSFHLDDSGVINLCAFLNSTLLVNRLIQQINAKQQVEFFNSLKGSIAKLDINLFAGVLAGCPFELGKFAVKDADLLELIEQQNQTRLVVIKRNLVESISLAWLKKYTFSIEDSADLVCAVSNLPEHNMPDSNPLFEPALAQFNQALQLCRKQNPHKKIEIFISIQKILTTVHPNFLKKVLESLNEFLMSQRKLLDFVLNSGDDFAPLADALLKLDGIRVCLVKELFEYDEKKYLGSDAFKKWFTLPSGTLTNLILFSDEIKQAIVNRADFTLLAISKIRRIPLLESLIEECHLAIDDLTQILSQPEIHPRVAQAVLQKFKLLPFKAISPQQIAAFLSAISKHQDTIKFNELTIAGDLKDCLRTLFTNNELRSTSWLRIFAEYYARHPEEMAGLLFSDLEKALINLAQLKLTPQKRLSCPITENIALLMLSADLNDQQYAAAIKAIAASKELKEIWIVKALGFACNSLHRASLICAASPFSAYAIYKALLLLPEEQNTNKKLAFKHLLFGVLQSEHSLKSLQRIPHLINYFIQSKDEQFTTSQLLSTLKKDNVGFNFADVWLLLSSQPDLSVNDFNLIPYQFFAIDYLFLVAGIPSLNDELTQVLLEKYCQVAPKLYVEEFYTAISQSLKKHFSESQINALLIKFFQTPLLNQGPHKKEFETISIEEFDRLSETNLLYEPIPYRQGNNGCFAISAKSAVVFAGWFRDSRTNFQHNRHCLDHLWQKGIVATEITNQDAPEQNKLHS